MGNWAKMVYNKNNAVGWLHYQIIVCYKTFFLLITGNCMTC